MIQPASHKVAKVLIIVLSISFLPRLAIAENTSLKHDNVHELEGVRRLINQGRNAEALGKLMEIKGEDKRTSDYHFVKGRIMQELKRNIDAIAEYSIAIYLDDRNINARINKALTRGALGDINGALKELDEAALIDPRNPVIPMNRGVTLAGLNRPQEAIREFDRAIRINRQYSDAYRNRGIARHYLKDHPGACRDWRQASSNGDEEAYGWVKFYCITQPAVGPNPIHK